MGEAKRKKLIQSAAVGQLAELQHPLLAQAIRQVVGAITDFHGADCLLYANLGARVLRELGVDAISVAGSAAWRVGPGPVDTISHAREILGPLYMQQDSQNAVQFHAWVSAPGLLVDFTTYSLPLKAKQLDEADGGTTTVNWAPDYLWLVGSSPPGMLRTPGEVNQSYETGVFSYVRHADIEAKVLANLPQMLGELDSAVVATVTAYRALCAGHKLRVMGIAEDDTLQTEPTLRPLVSAPDHPH